MSKLILIKTNNLKLIYIYLYIFSINNKYNNVKYLLS